MKEIPLRPRIAVYTHDTFGLGHVRRCLNIINVLTEQYPDATVLLVTGSPALEFIKKLPKNVDFIKIPTIVKTGATGSQPPHLALGLKELINLRSRVIREAVLAFSPEVFLVDNFPLGAQTELLPLLQDLKGTHTKTILGLRDILNAPDLVKAEWERQGFYDILDRYYDKILIYGVKEVFNAIQDYAFPLSVQKKAHYCGYLTSTGPFAETPESIKEKLGVKGPLILATGGGGGDAFPLLSVFINALRQIPESQALIFTGPLMGKEDRDNLKALQEEVPNVLLQKFVPDLRPYLKAADVVVSMCGYNIASEIVFYQANAIVAPRIWRYGEHTKRTSTREENEQIMRAEALAHHGLVDLINPEELSPDTLAEKISYKLTHPKDPSKISTLKVQGAEAAVEHILELVRR